MDSGVSSATGKRYRHFGVLPLPIIDKYLDRTGNYRTADSQHQEILLSYRTPIYIQG